MRKENWIYAALSLSYEPLCSVSVMQLQPRTVLLHVFCQRLSYHEVDCLNAQTLSPTLK